MRFVLLNIKYNDIVAYRMFYLGFAVIEKKGRRLYILRGRLFRFRDLILDAVPHMVRIVIYQRSPLR